MGFVYLTTNENMPDLVKIGMTDSIQKRMDELSSASGVPGQFVCQFYREMENPARIEKELHDLFSYCRVNERRRSGGREFFRVDWLSVAVALVILTEKDHEKRVNILTQLAKEPDEQEDDKEVGVKTSPENARDARRTLYMKYATERVARDTTPIVYDRALSYLSEHYLDGKDVYSITDARETEAIYQRFRKYGDLYDANREYQAGAMSSAIGMYIKFIHANPPQKADE